MFEKLSVFESKYEELSSRLCDPAVAGSAEKYTQTMKELKEIEEVALKYREYKNCLKELNDAREMKSEEKDPELSAMIDDEISGLELNEKELTEQLKLLLVPKDPNDDRNVIVEIRGGAGGEEAALFAAVLYRMYSMYAVKQGWSSEMIGANETELGGFKEVSFMLNGSGAYSRMKFESGVHRVQRVPETESQGRIQTSTVTVAVLPEADEVELEINPTELKIDVFRASGALQMVQDGLTAAVEWCGLNSDFVGAVPVALMKPLNGAGARGMMLECFELFGPDSFVGHLASVLQGSTDTTFYILAIYFGSVGIKKYRYSVACGLLADIAGMIAAVFISYFFFG